MLLKLWGSELDAITAEIKRWKPEESSSRVIKSFLEESFLYDLKQLVKGLASNQAARQAQEAQIEVAVCFADESICVTTTDGSIRLANPAFQKMSGYTGEEAIGVELNPLLSLGPITRLNELKKALSEGRTWRGELTATSKDGSNIITEVNAAPVTDQFGKVTHHVYIQRDVTEKVKLEGEIRSQKVFLEKVMNLVSSAIVVIGAKGEWWLDNLAAKTLLSDMGTDSRKRLSSMLLEEIGGRLSVKEAKVRIPLTKGRIGCYLMEAERIPAGYLMPEQGESAGQVYLASLSDITVIEKKNMEILARHRHLTSLRMERAMLVKELADSFAYRMRQPLNVARAVVSRIESLTEAGDRDDLKETTALLRARLEEMESEIKRLRVVTRSASPTGAVSSAKELFESIEILYRERFESNRIALELEAPPEDVTLPISDEAAQMAAAILMENAFDAASAPEGHKRKVVVRAVIDEFYTGIAVEDGGKGISVSERLKIFEPFHSGGEEKKGLSLTLLHQVVSEAGGTIKVGISALGGAAFTIQFPREAPCSLT